MSQRDDMARFSEPDLEWTQGSSKNDPDYYDDTEGYLDNDQPETREGEG